MDAIVYTSNTGFTKRYAEMLATETGLVALDWKQAKKELSKGAQIIYLGWLKAGSIVKYNQANGYFHVRAVCAVGMSSPNLKQTQELLERYRFTCPLFYLQGGICIEKLHGVYRFMMKCMSKLLGKKLRNNPQRTADEDQMLQAMDDGGIDCVSEDNLVPVMDWFIEENGTQEVQ